MSYFEILPEELRYILLVKLIKLKDIYNCIKICKLNYDKSFKMLCDGYCPFLKKYGIYQEFRGRRISWHNIFDMILRKIAKNLSERRSDSILSLYSHGFVDCDILLLDEYKNKNPEDSDSLAYEYLINNICSIYGKVLGSLELYDDIIKLGADRYESKHRCIEKDIYCKNKLIVELPDKLYIYKNTDIVVKYDEYTGEELIAICVLEKGKLRHMNDAERIIALGVYHLSYLYDVDLSIYKIKTD